MRLARLGSTTMAATALAATLCTGLAGCRASAGVGRSDRTEAADTVEGNDGRARWETASRSPDDEPARRDALSVNSVARTSRETAVEVEVGRSGTSAAVETVSPVEGRTCRVHFRRDAVGLAGQVPLGIGNNDLPARRAQVTGTVESLDPDWLVLNSEGITYWIPRGVILALEFTPTR